MCIRCSSWCRHRLEREQLVMRHTHEMMAVQSIVNSISSSVSPVAATHSWLDAVTLVQLQCLLPSLSPPAVATSQVKPILSFFSIFVSLISCWKSKFKKIIQLLLCWICPALYRRMAFLKVMLRSARLFVAFAGWLRSMPASNCSQLHLEARNTLFQSSIVYYLRCGSKNRTPVTFSSDFKRR